MRRPLAFVLLFGSALTGCESAPLDVITSHSDASTPAEPPRFAEPVRIEALALAGPDDDPSGGNESESETDTPDDIEPLDTPQKGGAVAVNDAGTLLAVANRATDDVSVFALPELTQVSRFDAGDEPVSVSFASGSSELSKRAQQLID